MAKKDAKSRAEQAARMLAEQRRKQRQSTLLKISSVIAAMVVIVAICVVVGLKHGGSDKVSADAAIAGSSPYSLTIGKKSAPHKVIMYEDFLCPFCDQFELAGSAQLAQLAAVGKVYLDYRPFHLLPEDYSAQALNAFAVVLKTSGPEVAKKFHELLYRNQPSESGPFPPVSSLVDLAVQAGADESAVKDGIENNGEKAWVDAAPKAAEDAGVHSTPTILLDGKVYNQGNSEADIAANLIKAVS